LLISVVIPTVDRREQFQRAVEGVLRQQTSFPFEVVIVDNSTSGSQRWILDAVAPAQQSDAEWNVRYIHEPRPGLASARNRGVAESRGTYIVFLDDDERPLTEMWLEMLVSAVIGSGATASFGPVYPQFEYCPKNFWNYLQSIYTRELKRADHDRITDLISALGTGNSCFHKQSAFDDGGEGFSAEFDKTGGEDGDLLYRLRRAGRHLVWAANAPVIESVPAAKLEMHDLAQRRFRQGQQRTFLQIASGRKRYGSVVFWMTIGGAQIALYATIAALHSLSGNKEAARLHWVKMYGGLGKVFWQAKFRKPHYRM